MNYDAAQSDDGFSQVVQPDPHHHQEGDFHVVHQAERRLTEVGAELGSAGGVAGARGNFEHVSEYL